MGEVLQRPLLRQRDVARIFGVHRVTVARWTRLGIIPAVKVGGARRYRPEDVEALIEARGAATCTTNSREVVG